MVERAYSDPSRSRVMRVATRLPSMRTDGVGRSPGSR